MKPPLERILSRITITEKGCWEWNGAKASEGYGHIRVGSRRDGSSRLVGTHILVYKALIGEVPEGKELDHLCRNHPCCNPDHLEPVTRRENALRGDVGIYMIQKGASQTHCLRGHLFDEANTYVDKHGKRSCKTCRRVAFREWKRRRKADEARRLSN